MRLPPVESGIWYGETCVPLTSNGDNMIVWSEPEGVVLWAEAATVAAMNSAL
jgi:hypothetical protein